MAKQKEVKKQSEGHLLAKAGIGLVAAAVAAAAGSYFVYEKSSPKTKKKIKGWTLKAKGEVLERLESLKEVNEKAYNEIVEQVGKQYRKMKDIDSKEVDKLTDEMKKHWKNIYKEHEVKQGKRKTSVKEHSVQKSRRAKS